MSGVVLVAKYISTEAGTTARKTVPTNRNRKLEKLVIRSSRCSLFRGHSTTALA